MTSAGPTRGAHKAWHRSAGRVVLLFVAITAGVGCAPTPTSAPTTYSGQPGSETWVAYSPGSLTFEPTAIVQYNGFGTFSWLYTQVGGGPWTACDVTQPACTGGLNPLAPGQFNWRGDPAIAAEGRRSGVVVAVNMANSVDHPTDVEPDMVVAALSTDGGRTFTRSFEVTSGKPCADGNQDQPAIAVDNATTPPTFYVAWRNATSGPSGACVQAFTVDRLNQVINFIGTATEVTNLDRSPFYGVGGLLLQANAGVLTLMYSNTDHRFYDCSSGLEVKWFTTTSTDYGVHWDHNTEIYDTHNFTWCATSSGVYRGKRDFGFARGSDGTYWAAVNDTAGTIRIFSTTDPTTAWTPGPTMILTEAWQPTVVVDENNTVGVSFFGTDLSDTQISMYFTAKTLTSGWSLPVSLTAPFGLPAPVPGTVNVELGDFLVNAAVPSAFSPSHGTFLNAWTDESRFGAGNPEIATTVTRVVPP